MAKSMQYLFEKAELECHGLGQIVLRIQARYIRSAIAPEIEAFENSFDEIIQTAELFLTATEKISESSDIADSYPGKEMGMVYDEDTKYLWGAILHKNKDADPSEVPTLSTDEADINEIKKYWHIEHFYHPIRHVPGTTWHKFFGGIRLPRLTAGNPSLFLKKGAKSFFVVNFPETVTWLAQELGSEYEMYRALFDRATGEAGQYSPARFKNLRVNKIQQRFSSLFRGWKTIGDERIVLFEELDGLTWPEHEGLGFSKFEFMSVEMNDPDLTGVALTTHEMPEIPNLLHAYPYIYYFKPACQKTNQ
ncbi:uncharacterized protein CTHT_0011890 [Thermochaetoides thermophila DSM 1495]|uniref:Uncharacterized protein n=1 Tax=Chaetomium thermophilum (strain DSM 1495 / CBS 144.50 / IMI 039719) TaxID=759272 RepID=G0S105_CHATD|nr:hypothetical protein CTHT_0011890 [Thermochaetoides thermophila DSM 1495]EGS22715.1 hypothetical protein CTHT_0011890 [Thermochaetoides thermophila DSM 1495]